jgi:tyrosyl-tRNA synthetase
MERKNPVITSPEAIDEALTRGVVEVLPSRDGLRKLMQSGKQLKLYQGFDPTAPKLHIGSMVGLRKLRQFQDLGHEVIFLIGDGTGQAGDPSGKLRARDRYFTHKELLANARAYKKQVSKILRFTGENPVKMLFNGKWLNPLRLVDILDIAGNFTLQQLSERDLFQERMKRGEAVNLREFLYPLLQGYDSVAMEVDLEIGGHDQLFNMLTGRVLSKRMLGKEKFVLATPLLTDAQGQKIGKSENNAIWLTDEPNDMYGKIMSLSDDTIVKGFEYLTDVPMDEVREIEKKIIVENPKPYKERLAFEIVAQLHGIPAAKKASAAFREVFSQREIPDDIEEVPVAAGVPFDDALYQYRIVSSKSEARRLMMGGGVKDISTGEKITDPKRKITIPLTLKLGKHRFIKIVIKRVPKRK